MSYSMMNNRNVDTLDRTIPARAAKAAKRAYKEAIAAGFKVLIVSNGSLYEVGPNSARRRIRFVGHRIQVKKGTRIKVK